MGEQIEKMTDADLLAEIAKRCVDLSFLAQVKRLVAKKKDDKITFQQSSIFEKSKFKSAFPSWGTQKLRYYYNSAESYSIEGNKYVDWKRAISNWAERDEIKGIKFPETEVYKGNVLNGHR